MQRRANSVLVAAILCSAFLIQVETARLQSNTGVVNQSIAELKNLPPALRERALALLKQSDENERVKIVQDLVRMDVAGATDFLLEVLERDSSPKVRYAIINRVGRRPQAKVREALERHAASDPDARVSLLALERVRGQQNQEMRKLLNRRMEAAKKSGDKEAWRLLAQEDERWISLVRGTMLPSFLRIPPARFSVKAKNQLIRVLAFGDYGTGSDAQRRVAAAMLKYHRKSPFDFGITLGDNFYSEGMASPEDPRWKTWWDALYSPLGIQFYTTLGNHDWGLPDSPAAEILYSRKSSSWRMPSPYYTYTAGPVQFFALDTNEISQAQMAWITEELDKSRARWKVVYGHHPVYSYGTHEDNKNLIASLLPVLKGRADVYLAGHDHDLQHIKPEGGVHFFVAGGGGAGIRPVAPGAMSLFAKSAHGFAVLEADTNQFTVKFIGIDLAPLYQYTLRNDQAASAKD